MEKSIDIRLVFVQNDIMYSWSRKDHGPHTATQHTVDKTMSDTKNKPNNLLPLKRYEFLHIRALCDAIMTHLCQAKAMLTPFEEEDFIHRFSEVELKHYFYAMETILEEALTAKDAINHAMDRWGKQTNDKTNDKANSKDNDKANDKTTLPGHRET